jgi:hypothetical protein
MPDAQDPEPRSFPPPGSLRTRADFAEALRKVKGEYSYAYLHKQSLALVADPPGRWRPEELKRATVSGWLDNGRQPGLPAKNKLVTFLWVCQVSRTDMSAWIAARDRIAASPSAAGPPAEDLGEGSSEVARSTPASDVAELPTAGVPRWWRRFVRGPRIIVPAALLLVAVLAVAAAAPTTPAANPMPRQAPRADSPPPTASIVLYVFVPTVAPDRFVAMGREGDPAFDTYGYARGQLLGRGYPAEMDVPSTHIVYDHFCRGPSAACEDLKRSHYYSTDPTPRAEPGWRRQPPKAVARFLDPVDGRECAAGQQPIFGLSRKEGRVTSRSISATNPGGWTEVEMLGCLISPS